MNKVLEKAIELAEKYDLAKGWFARDAYGGELFTHSEKACAFCTMGFLDRAFHEIGGSGTYELYKQAFNSVADLLPENTNIASFNDDPKTTKEDIIALFRKANEQST